MKTHRPLLALLLGLAPLAGCDAATNVVNGTDAILEKTAEKVAQKTDDEALSLAVKGALVKADDKLGWHVKVGALGGVVSLSGKVPTPEDKARAEDVASKVKGVTKVLNAIDVEPN
jgi:hyperosmotically inducible periplasmic protein